MNQLVPILGAFVVGVFVGAGQWFALVIMVAVLVAWHLAQLPPRDPPSLDNTQRRLSSLLGRFL
jgi:hypothetical protein